MNEKANASAKSKEVQPTAQSQRIAPHLLLPPTAQLIQIEQKEF